ncbi:MAG: phage tail family protein [Lachnospiraceae bacterium]|nr:phage tail family protein [Lachnospiraceae bacterium]
MVRERVIIVSNGSTSLTLTNPPYYVKKTEGWDELDVELVTSQGFDQDGATELNSYIQPRSMTITGQLYAETSIQMQQLHDNILNLFLPKREIRITNYFGGKNRVITASVTKTPNFEHTDVTKVDEYTVKMEATKPYWQDPGETLIQIANVVATFHFPFSINKNTGMVFGVKSPSLIAAVYNYSVIKVGMRFVFIANGTLSNPQLFNIKTREFFKLKCDMQAGEIITVQTGTDKTVTRNVNGVEEDYIGKIDIPSGGNTFLELAPGDNLLRYSADTGEDMLEVKLYFNNKYLGV